MAKNKKRKKPYLSPEPKLPHPEAGLPDAEAGLREREGMLPKIEANLPGAEAGLPDAEASLLGRKALGKKKVFESPGEEHEGVQEIRPRRF